MKTRFLRGTTAQNNTLTLPMGEISIDLERNAVRLHDGQTLGGFEMVGTQAYATPVGPGPTTLIAGNETLGLYGEVTSESFLDTNQLSTAIGLSAGVIHTEFPTWIKYSLDGKVGYFPMVPLRSGLGWEAIYQAGAVYGDDTTGVSPLGTLTVQSAQVMVGNDPFKVRLFDGTENDPSLLNYSTGAYSGSPDQINSDWDRLFKALMDGTLATYTDSDFGFTNSVHSWCQSTSADSPTSKSLRGVNGYHDLYFRADTSRGWRPVLELIQ